MASITVTTAENPLAGGKREAPQGRAGNTYKALQFKREPYLIRARRLAKLTIPSLFPELGFNATTSEELPWSSIGAFLVNNLASKVILSMFPAGRPPMKLKQDRRSMVGLNELAQTDPDKAAALKEQIDQGLSKVEQEFSEVMEEDGDRAKLNVGARKLIVGGNHCLKFDAQTGALRGVPLERFVVRRAPNGDPIEFVIEDAMAWETLSPDVRALALRNGYMVDPTRPIQETVCVYTHGRRQEDLWTIYQEAYSEEVPGTRYQRNDDVLEFLFLGWNLLEGEDYARSYAEDYEADLTTVDGLEQSISETAAAMALFLQLVNPTGLTSKRSVSNARNGDVLSGRAEDVTTVQAEKAADLQVPSSQQDKITQRLGRAFLFTGAVVRDAERVTAREIYEVAQELEEQLGGVYSQQVTTFQLPYVTRKMRYAQRDGRVTQLPDKTVKVSIIGGMGALSRSADLQALDSWMEGPAQFLGPQALAQAIGPAGIRMYMQRRGASLGVDTDGLLPTQAEGRAQDQQQQMAQMMSNPAVLAAIQQYGQNQTANQVADTKAQSATAVAQTKAAPPQATAPSTSTPQ